MHPHSLHLPLLTLLISPLVVPLSLPLNLTQHPPNPSLTSEIQCRNPRIRLSYLSTADCIHTLRLLPSTHIPGTFHTDGADDPFKLPRSATQGNCHLQVELLRGHAQEESSWLAVRQAAAELAFACAKQNEPGLTKGGYTAAGLSDGIYIRLMKPERERG